MNKVRVADWNDLEPENPTDALVAKVDLVAIRWKDEERLHKFTAWERGNAQPYDRDASQGLYADVHGAPEEPHFKLIQELATHGLDKSGAHGPVSAMGVPRTELPSRRAGTTCSCSPRSWRGCRSWTSRKSVRTS